MAIHDVCKIPIVDGFNLIYSKYLFRPLLTKGDEYRYFHDEIETMVLKMFQARLGLIKRYEVNGLGLYIGDNCNMKCKYCHRRQYVQKNNHNLDKMFESIEYLHKYNPNINNVQITGGEPFANAHFLGNIIDYIKSLFGKDVLFSFNTNGTIINDNLLRILKNINYKVSVSLDGNREIHDENRIFHDNCGTFDVIGNTIDIYQKNGIRIEGALTVIGDGSLALDIDEFLSFLSFLVTRNINYVGLQTDKFNTRHIKKKFNLMMQIMERARDYGIKCGGECMLLTDKLLNFEEFNDNIFFASKCTLYNLKSISVDYNRNIINCCYAPNRVLALNNYIVFVEKMDLDWIIDFYEKNECNSCLYWAFCTGKCASVETHDAECFMKRLVFSYLLKHDPQRIINLFSKYDVNYQFQDSETGAPKI